MGLGSSIKKAFKKAEDVAKGAVDVATLGTFDAASDALLGGDGPAITPIEVEALETVRKKAGIASTLLTGASGVEETEDQLKRKTLLGSKSMLGKA